MLLTLPLNFDKEAALLFVILKITVNNVDNKLFPFN